jgi:hypothetical protein
MKGQLHLNLFLHSRGHHEASWRHPVSSLLPLTDIRYYQDLAQRAEAALFDSIFLADQLALGGGVDQAPRTWLEPITVLAALAVATIRWDREWINTSSASGYGSTMGSVTAAGWEPRRNTSHCPSTWSPSCPIMSHSRRAQHLACRR